MIPVLNIYYMLSYAFSVLNENEYKSVETEEFHNVADLCAAILIKGVSMQLKRGLWREYISQTDALASPRGKIEISDTVRTRSVMKRQLVCTHDEFTVDCYMNRILKTTMLLLVRSDIDAHRKKELRKLLVYFGDVGTLDIYRINWVVQFNRNNATYRMLISVCYLVVKGLLQTQSDGSMKLMDFLDEQHMHHLYEKFILEYYRKEFPQIKANAAQIPWQLDDDFSEMLPIMQSDITLSYGPRTLIIDAKYYSHSLQRQYDRYTAHSGNLYQIFTYVKNKEAALTGRAATEQAATGQRALHEPVAGMLLYAQTDSEGSFCKEYQMSGNPIAVRTLDLSCEFGRIREQLDGIAEKYLKVSGE